VKRGLRQKVSDTTMLNDNPLQVTKKNFFKLPQSIIQGIIKKPGFLGPGFSVSKALVKQVTNTQLTLPTRENTCIILVAVYERYLVRSVLV
jgi:hypothetical protein